ncbi:ABC transporter permease [Pararhodobacter zhoushanensis]|uniref:ABC transporter permease n=1 Tax=Pararhodobacter zhoushanensis TaxID=2479545 RepID=A0ABT3H2R2_9RHOB|nr:ABC transporter permease [Pararhodobacter zhoushanensis]MCW1404399.1 ABC transporter permease [Novosphingobium sp. MW5]MCW1933988.1 ABC transporter permease [Pararhodobacter zhoushanensis]
MTLAPSPDGVARRPNRFLAILRALLREPIGCTALVILATVLLLALLAPLITQYDPLFQDRRAVLKAPSLAHWFGTDDIGRDVFSRVLYGTRISLLVGLLVVTFTMLIGGMIGLISGYFGGWTDMIIQRIVEALDTLPSLVLSLFIAAMLGPSVRNVVIAVTLAQIPRFVRVVRSEMIKVRAQDFIAASRVIGASSLRIMLTHGVPNLIPTMLVMGSLSFGIAIMTEAALSFLGVGTPPPNPSLGTMLAQGTRFIGIASWLIVFPGLMLTISVLALNLIGDALRDVLDPRRR